MSEMIEGYTTKLDLDKLIKECRLKAPKSSCRECQCSKLECIESLLLTYAEMNNDYDELSESLIEVTNELQE